MGASTGAGVLLLWALSEGSSSHVPLQMAWGPLPSVQKNNSGGSDLFPLFTMTYLISVYSRATPECFQAQEPRRDLCSKDGTCVYLHSRHFSSKNLGWLHKISGGHRHQDTSFIIGSALIHWQLIYEEDKSTKIIKRKSLHKVQTPAQHNRYASTSCFANVKAMLQHQQGKPDVSLQPLPDRAEPNLCFYPTSSKTFYYNYVSFRWAKHTTTPTSSVGPALQFGTLLPLMLNSAWLARHPLCLLSEAVSLLQQCYWQFEVSTVDEDGKDFAVINGFTQIISHRIVHC